MNAIETIEHADYYRTAETLVSGHDRYLYVSGLFLAYMADSVADLGGDTLIDGFARAARQGLGTPQGVPLLTTAQACAVVEACGDRSFFSNYLELSHTVLERFGLDWGVACKAGEWIGLYCARYASEPLTGSYSNSYDGRDPTRGFRLPWEVRETWRQLLRGPVASLPWHNGPLPETTLVRRKPGTGEDMEVTLPALPMLQPIPGHFASLHPEDNSKVWYTDTPAKGERDIKTVQKLGRYLAKFYPDLRPEEISRWAAVGDKLNELHIATTSDEIVTVYLNGPSSCMSHSLADYDSPVHPVSVYGDDGDLHLAYVVDQSNKPVARVLIWPAEKRYGRIYGDIDRLVPLLAEAGYSGGSLKGARIKRIEIDSDTLVMPYIDGQCSFDEYDDNFVVIGGAHEATDTDGTAALTPRCSCIYCDETIYLDDVCYTPDDEPACESCYSDRWTQCDHTGETVSVDDIQEVLVRPRYSSCRVTTKYWCSAAVANNAFYSDRSGDYFSDEHFSAVEVQTGRNCFETWTSEEAEAIGCVEIDGELYHPKHIPDGYVCVDGDWVSVDDIPDDDDDTAEPQPEPRCTGTLEMPL